jgi:hypothetical protein
VKLDKANIDRLALSARVLEGWEALGGPSGTLAETLRLVEAEIAILAVLRDQAPDVVDDLVARYGRLADTCPAKIN